MNNLEQSIINCIEYKTNFYKNKIPVVLYFSLDDLRSDLTLQALKAIDDFNACKGFKLITLVSTYIDTYIYNTYWAKSKSRTKKAEQLNTQVDIFGSVDNYGKNCMEFLGNTSPEIYWTDKVLSLSSCAYRLYRYIMLYIDEISKLNYADKHKRLIGFLTKNYKLNKSKAKIIIKEVEGLLIC